MSCDLNAPVGEVGGLEEGMVFVGTDVARFVGDGEGGGGGFGGVGAGRLGGKGRHGGFCFMDGKLGG